MTERYTFLFSKHLLGRSSQSTFFLTILVISLTIVSLIDKNANGPTKFILSLITEIVDNRLENGVYN